MVKATAVVTALILCLGLAGIAHGQTGNAQLGGIVADPSRALIPGVTITATNVATAVSVTQLTNDSGAYSFPVLQPGTYRVTADLSGFKKMVHEIQLGYATSVRDDFTLQVGASSQTVDVVSTSESALKETSASIGTVLTQQAVQDLPMVGNNVLSLLDTLPGLRFSPAGDAFNTINGVGMNSLNATRDGMSIINNRYDVQSDGRNVLSSTTLLPDLIGEIRLIVSPVDAELGRGNAQVQISTRSGTNRYNGAASWNVRNSALDANTWTNNHTIVNGAPTPLPWRNNHEYTVSYGGPISIPGLYNGKGKTFFYTVWDQNISNTRDPTVSANVLTDTARMGIYRYYTGYNPVGWNASSGIANQVYPLTAATASAVAVDLNGNPVAPKFNPDSSPYSGKLVCFSVFGAQRLDPANGYSMVPFTQADCPNGTAVFTQSNGAIWDANRPTFDTTGYIAKFLTAMPHANYFGANDGLNLGQFRWTRGRYGSNDAFTTEAGNTSPYVNRKQINIKIDHNFSAQHKFAASYSYERDDNAYASPNWPTGIGNNSTHRPHVLTLNFTSTISSRMINEARFGMNRNSTQTIPSFRSLDSSVRKEAQQWLVPAGASTLNPSFGNYLAVLNPSVGLFGDASGPIATGAQNLLSLNPYWNYADTLSWSHDKHAFKFGVELRLPRTAGNGSQNPLPTVSMGNNAGSTATASPFAASGFANDVLQGLNSAAVAGATAARMNVTNMLYFMSGSVNSASQPYWVTSADNIKSGLWSDHSTSGDRLRNQISQEWAAFFKDDFKITRRLTLNLGARWEYRSSPYIEGGFTAAVIGYGDGAFGAARSAQTTLDQFQKDPFGIWLRPGNIYLANYGLSSLSCQNGTQLTNALGNPIVSMGKPLVSTCDPNNLMGIQFVGPGSPNPKITATPVNYHDIGPAVGFSYSLPWFGEGKTTIRAGFQTTYGTAGQLAAGRLNGVENQIANAQGAFLGASTTIGDSVFQNILTGRALNLSDIPTLVPVRPTTAPGGSANIYSHTPTTALQSLGPIVYDPHFHTPYVENLNFSISHQLNSKFNVDLRYVGTFARKTQGAINLNTNNVYHNPEFLQALNDARRGGCDPNGYPSYAAAGISACDVIGDPVLLDQLLAGLNLNTTAGANTATDSLGVTRTFAPVGTVVNGVFQSGAEHLRKSSTFQNTLSFGDFNALTNALIALTPSAAQGRVGPVADTAGNPIAAVGLRNGCDRLGLGYTIVQQTTVGGAQVANSGAPIPLRCFPEDWLTTNPQFQSINYNGNFGHSNYHSLQTSVTARPTSGINAQFTWIWAKSMFLNTSTNAAIYVDPSNRNQNFTAQNINAHQFRMNGTFELPLGPNKLFFASSSGWKARFLERWQTSVIFNAATGTPASLSPGQSQCYSPGTSAGGAGCYFDIASPNWQNPQAELKWFGDTGNVYALPGSTTNNIITPYVGAADPSCSDPSIVSQGDRMGTNLGIAQTNPTTGAAIAAVCTIQALYARNPDGTPGEVLLKYAGEGKKGNLGQTTIMGLGQWNLDVNASKTFRVSESKSFQIRLDATNVLNHPVPGAPSLNAGGPLGAITTKTGQRALQGQLRVTF